MSSCIHTASRISWRAPGVGWSLDPTGYIGWHPMHLCSIAQSEADKERGKTDSSCLSDRRERGEQIE
ncbi:hypothetical protein POSPLADRAFT_1047534 [Postia placenta MAD-698-R-SB12]|uniref:Uncharacterized protein n=1 Tax=Postia placenta MAD-698-R-SB12 TaxID=670580 RepID=A0A1X6MYI5_9APHY|nr:hypothetical protein POSPLADRAFT_1047534 [Postia placenta MAD-698-R-SB12]OSX61310.1 hypothetical protein POSPLADRAFT_1047534 [Postia placenta MAD-698-R-SB12]